MLRVAIHTEGESPKIVEFPYDQRVTFGRADDNDIVLPPAYVSRQHGEFLFEDGEWWVIDRGSLTGMAITRPESERLQLSSGGRERLLGGEAIEILHTLLRIEVKPIESLMPVEEDWWEESAGTVATIASARMESVRRAAAQSGERLAQARDAVRAGQGPQPPADDRGRAAPHRRDGVRDPADRLALLGLRARRGRRVRAPLRHAARGRGAGGEPDRLALDAGLGGGPPHGRALPAGRESRLARREPGAAEDRLGPGGAGARYAWPVRRARGRQRGPASRRSARPTST